MKDIRWVGRSLDDGRAFPADARRQVGHQLHLLQLDLEPADWRPMPSVGAGAREVRIHGEMEYRVRYVTRFPEAIYVLHASGKKSRQTPRRDIDLGRERLKELPRWRRANHD